MSDNNSSKLSSSKCATESDNEDENNNENHRLHATGGKVSYAERKLLNKKQKILEKKKRQSHLLFPKTPTFFEYDAVNSLTDDASSTCSSDFSLTNDYVRMPGFDHHGHTKLESIEDEQSSIIEADKDQIKSQDYDLNGNLRLKKKKNVKKKTGSNKKSSKINSPRAKPKRDPLPMKLRALPQSFWQQPNNTNVLSPGTVYPVLPPLAANSRELTPPEDRPEGIISVANTDLLFSLFREVEAAQRKIQGKQQIPAVVKRGRPKKPPTSLSKSVLKDDDPCLVSTVTDTILPLIPVDKTAPNSIQAQIAEGQQVLAMVSLNGEREDVILPNLNTDHKNYSQILSDLVIQL